MLSALQCRYRRNRWATTAILFFTCGAIFLLATFDDGTKEERRQLQNKGQIVVTAVQEIGRLTPSPTPQVAPRLPGPYIKLRYSGGRIGNDLFSLASGYGLAKKHGYSFCINTLSLEIIDSLPSPPSGFTVHRIERYFEGPFDFCDKHWKVKSKPIRAGHHANNFELRDLEKYGDQDLEVSDFMQSYANFRHVKDEVLSMLTFNQEYKKKASSVLEPRNGYIIIGIHARRGDKIDCHYCDAPGDEYYARAIERMRQELVFWTDRNDDNIKKKVRFLVASEGAEGKRWFKEQKQGKGMFSSDEFEYVGSSDPMLDLAVLSSCDHMLASGGTFSWWAAFLGATQTGGIVIHSSRLRRDAYDNPEEWISIDDSSRATKLIDGSPRATKLIK